MADRGGDGGDDRRHDGGVADGTSGLDRRLGAVLDGIDEVVFLKDREGRYQYVNAAGTALFDAPPEAVVGRTDAELFDPETAAKARETDETVLAGESVTVRETRGERAFRTRKYPYRRDGRVEGVVGVARDVTGDDPTGTERERNERALRALQRLASDRSLSFEEKLDRALAVGRQRLDLPVAFLTRVEDDTQTVVAADDETGLLEPGTTAPLEETYCRRTLAADGVLAVEEAGDEWDGDPAYERFGLECYLGAPVRVDGALYGTLCFASPEPRDCGFSEAAETVVELLVEWMSYELERRERAEELERFETIVRAVDDGVYALDAEGNFEFVNPAMTELTGYEAADLVGEHLSTVKDDDGTRAALAALLAGEADERTVESPVQPKRGRPVTCEDNMARLAAPDGSTRGVVGVVRDITEQTAQREMLSELVASSRAFMQARDREEVAGLVADAVADVLGFELNVVRLFDRETERLVPAGTTDAVTERLGDPPTYDIEDGAPGEAFVDGETVVVADTADLDDGYDREVVRSSVHVPMGVHGTISIGGEEPDAFPDVDRRAIELLATSGAAAANRARREQQVRAARERAETLVDRINGLIEDTVEVLVQAGTREELERGVVDQLVATDPYAFAWIARPDVAAERLDATAWAGDVPDLAEAVEGHAVDMVTAREAGDPTVRALDDEQLQVADLDSVPEGSVHARAGAAGLGSMVAVPLVYRDASYGVLVVYTGEPDAVADREQVVLDALGRAVANAVNAIESGRILTANRVIELEFTVRDDALFLARLSSGLGADLELAGSVHRADGALTLYVTATGTDGDAVAEALDGDPAVTEATVIAAHDDEVLFEATLSESLVELLADHGAVTQAATAADAVARFTVELPYEAEAREVFELVADRYAGTDLVGYHEHERPVETRQAFRETVFDRLTDRQETAVRTAYLGGFFEWPRDVDGDDLADSMDISRPTYHQHLRAAQRKVFEELFEHGSR